MVKSYVCRANGSVNKARHIKKFYRRNWYRIMFLLLAVLSNIITARVCSNKTAPLVEEVKVAAVEPFRPETLAYKEPVVNADAAALARVLYGVKDYQLSDNAKIAVIEVVLNRVACSYGEFGDNIKEVCDKPQQWQGYLSDGSYLTTDYELALNRINDTSGARQIPDGCYFLSCSQGEVSVRTDWNGGNTWTVK